LENLWKWPIREIADWVHYLANPSELVVLCIQESKSGSRAVVEKFWFFPIGCSMAINAVLVLRAYGFDIQSQAPALAIYFVYMCLKSLFGAIAITVLLSLFRFTPRRDIVFSCYTIVVMYAPIFSVLDCAGSYYQLEILSQIKAQHLDFADSFRFLRAHANEMKQSEIQATVITVSAQLESAMFVVANVLTAECLTRYLMNDRFKTYLAVWLSFFVSFLPTVALNGLWSATMFRYII
jgi:hypothetical protein